MTLTARALLMSTSLLMLLASGPAAAQGPGAVPAPQVPPPSTGAVAQTAIAPDSPRGAFRRFREAAHGGQWSEAAQFLVLDDANRARGADLARRLNAVIESLYAFDPDSISATSEGRLDDGLPPDIEQIATTDRAGAPEPIRMIRVPRESRSVWMFTPATVARTDAWYDRLYSRWLRERIVGTRLQFLLHEGPFNLFYWQWLAFPLIALFAWAVGRGVHAVAKPVMERVTRRTRSRWDDRIVESLGPPFTLAVATAAFAAASVFTDLNRESFRFVTTLVRPMMVFALFWAIWRVSTVLLTWSMSRSWALNSPSARNLLAIGTNISRGLIAGLGIVAMLAAAGFPVGTVLAGLGIGGLALAFGAQKTVENLFGSIALAIDQPIRVGDFVKVQDFVGTVEDIGIRSTRFRTLDRTVVSIPNGKLADERLESYELRDRMRLATTIGLTYGTTRAQLAAVLQGIEAVLRAHPKIWPDGLTVSFAGLGESSLDIEVMAWFDVPTWSDFQACRQEMLLAFMDVVERAGTSFAFPTRTVQLVQASAPALPQTTSPDGGAIAADRREPPSGRAE